MTQLTSRRERAGRILAPFLFALMILFGMRPFYPGFLVADRSQWAQYLDGVPDRRAPGYRALLLAADRIIPSGRKVAVLFPTLDWGQGYSYAYYRAQYFLAGRIVIPLSWTDGPQVQRLREAEYAIVYRASLPREGWTIVFTSEEGFVARRVR